MMPRQPASASLDEALTRLAALFDCGELLAATDPTAFIDSCIYRINDLTRKLTAALAPSPLAANHAAVVEAAREFTRLQDLWRSGKRIDTERVSADIEAAEERVCAAVRALDARLTDPRCPIHGDGHFEGHRCSCGGTEK